MAARQLSFLKIVFIGVVKLVEPEKGEIIFEGADLRPLGRGAWKPYQAGNDIGVSFVSADSIYPISTNTDGELTEVVFVNRIQDSKNVYNRLEWMHVLLGPEDYHDKERDILEARDVAATAEYPCVQVINLAFMGSTHN